MMKAGAICIDNENWIDANSDILLPPKIDISIATAIDTIEQKLPIIFKRDGEASGIIG